LFSLLAARVSGAVLPRWLVSLFAVRSRLRPRCSPCRSGVQSRFPRRIVASAWFGLATLFFESCVSCSCPDPVQACAKCVPISAAAPAKIPRMQGADFHLPPVRWWFRAPGLRSFSAALGFLLRFSRRLFSRWSTRLGLESAGPSVKFSALATVFRFQILFPSLLHSRFRSCRSGKLLN
jgi:hypothetical protein